MMIKLSKKEINRVLSALIVVSTLIVSCGPKSVSPEREMKFTAPSLPYIGPHSITEKTVNGVVVFDTIYHSIPSFSFINQNNEVITDAYFKEKVYLAEFFFTTCPSICPKMATTLQRVQEKMKGENRFHILSHSIDPEHDYPEVLKAYAKKNNADESLWTFVTGNRDSIYAICEESYMAFAKEDANAEGGYLHSGFLVLVDQNKHIRGVYDGTRNEVADSIVSDIKKLLINK